MIVFIIFTKIIIFIVRRTYRFLWMGLLTLVLPHRMDGSMVGPHGQQQDYKQLLLQQPCCYMKSSKNAMGHGTCTKDNRWGPSVEGSYLSVPKTLSWNKKKFFIRWWKFFLICDKTQKVNLYTAEIQFLYCWEGKLSYWCKGKLLY